MAYTLVLSATSREDGYCGGVNAEGLSLLPLNVEDGRWVISLLTSANVGGIMLRQSSGMQLCCSPLIPRVPG